LHAAPAYRAREGVQRDVAQRGPDPNLPRPDQPGLLRGDGWAANRLLPGHREPGSFGSPGSLPAQAYERLLSRRISAITPAPDRPRGIELCERYMARQTVQPHEWVVADGGQVPAKLTMGQVHLHQPSPPGAANLAGNILRALDAVTGDAVVIVEDDDHYAATHLEACRDGLKHQPAYGCSRLIYFNVEHRCWVQMANRGSALCQTAFRAELIPDMRQ